ncbi:hypothetical protein ACFPES_14935 [Paenibacillus sp. GCM10023248]|uniref:hypothetical protein n=1 Tax=Bacillales TaxID=1385 RepID=UPI0023796057|nr:MULTISPECIES: hypothetical protein [Bacillales]MDD9268333.1 hypothetical protein [Paenibacillus sp. MAHUQ-63]MDR6880014.1 RsiW-degrading membrane proteinase PrsW (M82 family) [Bacillus sp. 3255]
MIGQIAVFVIFILGWSIYRAGTWLNKKQPKTAVVYSCLMGVCMILGILVIAHVQFPNLTIPVRMVFEPVGKLILQQ